MGILDSLTGKPDVQKTQPTEMQGWQLRQAQDLWKHYKEKYVPLENKQIQQLLEFRSPGEQADAQNMASSVARQQMGDTTAALRPGETAGGAEQIHRALSLERAGGDTQARASANAIQAQEQRYQSALQSIIDAGTGQMSTAIGTTGAASAASAGMAAAHSAANNLVHRADAEGFSTALGAGAGVAGMMSGFGGAKADPGNSSYMQGGDAQGTWDEYMANPNNTNFKRASDASWNDAATRYTSNWLTGNT